MSASALFDEAAAEAQALGHSAQVWFDFTDISQMYQDVALDVPVTATGQVINAIKSKGTVSGATADTSRGSSTAPIYTTGQINSLSGAVFDGGLTQSLITASVTVGAADTDVYAMAVWKTLGTPSPSGGYVFNMGVNMDSLENTTSTNINAIKSQQSYAHSGSVTEHAGWLWQNSAGDEASISNTAGTDSNVYGVSSITSDQFAIGSNQAGSTSWLDNTAVCEFMCWVGAANVPTTAEIEAYVTTKYGIAWA